MSEQPKSSIFEKFIPVLLLLSVVLAFMVGVLWQKVSNLEGGTKNTNTPQQAAQANPKVDIEQIKGLMDKNMIIFGNKDAKVIFVEFSDPSCPYCHIAGGLNPELNNQVGPQFKLVKDGGTYEAPVLEMKKLVDEGKAAFVWGYFNGHGNGELATKALYCAFDEGKFWEAHDLLMTSKGYDFINNVAKNDVANIDKIVEFLKPAGLAGLKDCLASGKYDSRLQEEMNLGRELGISGTPGFFVNETNFAGAYSFVDMKSLVDSLLK